MPSFSYFVSNSVAVVQAYPLIHCIFLPQVCQDTEYVLKRKQTHDVGKRFYFDKGKHEHGDILRFLNRKKHFAMQNM